MKFVSAIIVAAGVGKRMNAPIPKQFIEINGKSILEHTIDNFLETNFFNEIIVVVSEDYLSNLNQIFSQKKQELIKLCIGGKERFHTVKRALQILDNNCTTVFIHDAVRPFCTATLLNKCLEASKDHEGIIPTLSMKDSVREVTANGKSKSIDRSKLRSVQTPQVFDSSKLVKAYAVDFSEKFTDDASVFENAGYPIHLIEGENTNFKITTPEDLEIARRRLS